MSTLALQLENITKVFPNVIANEGVNFDLRKGEVHALLGENGAGKSTLMNVVYGLYKADSGTIKIDGEIVTITNPNDAIAHGIGMVHQHFMLVPRFTILENVILGTDCRKGLVVDLKNARAKVQELCDKYKLNVNIDCQVRDLSVGIQQRVEIIKMLYRGAEILILDEPTAVLTPNEVEDLMETLRLFRTMGKSIIFISHKLWEVTALSDRVTVLRAGKVVDTVDTRNVTKESLATMMVGRDIVTNYRARELNLFEEVLRLENVCVKSKQTASSLKNISLCVRGGEIVGIAGVDGNGQREIGDAIVGVSALSGGKVYFKGKDYSQIKTRKRLQAGIAHIPEDRQRDGLIADFTIAENMIIDEYDQPPFTVKGVFVPKAMKRYADELIHRFDVRPPIHEILGKDLSGGNQQKVVVARELSRSPGFILAMQPTRGLDVGASEFVYKKLLEERNAGKGVLVISADLDELLMICDRILVLFEGEIMGEFVPGIIGYGQIGLMMGGQRLEGLA
ncbi:MAG: ABC transporter ATP-binding protein [Bacillota bacterium]